GVFKLDSKATLPWTEMTGLSLRATEVALMALRALKNWEVLAEIAVNATEPASVKEALMAIVLELAKSSQHQP
ncbi:MAG: hypothetical protein ACR2LR_04260, partial [Hassallia sp.]